MNLRDRILSTLRQGAVVTTALGATACGEAFDFGSSSTPIPTNASCTLEGDEPIIPDDVSFEAATVGRHIFCVDADADGCATLDDAFDETLASGITIPTSDDCSPNPPQLIANPIFCGPVAPSDGARCCYTLSMYRGGSCVVGRPFTVDGLLRLAEVTSRTGWSSTVTLTQIDDLTDALRFEIASSWAESGTHEHASIAAFSRSLMDLLGLGAPRELVKDTTQAIQDEIDHAHDCFSIASAYARAPLGPDTVDTSGDVHHATVAEILHATIVEGCIGESVAAVEAQWLGARVSDPFVARALAKIARDEADHALLAWRIARWVLKTHPHLAATARDAFATAELSTDSVLPTGLDGKDLLLVQHGALREVARDQIRRHAFAHTVAPCIDALFEGSSCEDPSERGRPAHSSVHDADTT